MSNKKSNLFDKADTKPSMADVFSCDPFPKFIIFSTLVAIVAALCVAAATYPAVKAKNDAADAAQARSDERSLATPTPP